MKPCQRCGRAIESRDQTCGHCGRPQSATVGFDRPEPPPPAEAAPEPGNDFDARLVIYPLAAFGSGLLAVGLAGLKLVDPQTAAVVSGGLVLAVFVTVSVLGG